MTTWILVLKGVLNLSCKTYRILVLRTLKISLQNDGSVNVFKSSYPSWRPVLKTGLQDVFKVHLCPLGMSTIFPVLQRNTEHEGEWRFEKKRLGIILTPYSTCVFAYFQYLIFKRAILVKIWIKRRLNEKQQYCMCSIWNQCTCIQGKKSFDKTVMTYVTSLIYLIWFQIFE